MSFDPSLPDDRVNVSHTHPLREALALVASLLLLAAGLAVVVGLCIDFAIPRLPPKLEMRLFANAWLAPALEAAPADPRQAQLSALLERLARHWPECPYTLRVAIYDAEEPNALALPGGWIAVSTGLLDAAESENEVAFVLGHEIGHFRHRDHLRGLGRGLAGAMVLAAVGIGAGAGSASELASLGQRLADRGFSRAQERAADATGLELVAAEYGHVGGALDFFARMSQGEGSAAGAYLSTHPLSRDRIQALRALAAERGYPAEGPLRPFAGGRAGSGGRQVRE